MPEDVAAWAAAAAGAAAADLSDDALCEEALAIESLRRFLDARQAHLLAELEQRKTCDRAYGLGTGAWLAREAGLSASACRRRVRVARKLARWFPAVDAALAAGRISWDHATVIADAANDRIIDAIAACQAELLDLAQNADLDWWRRQVQGIAALLDHDGGHDPADDEATNTFTMTATFDGLHHLAGTLTGEHALITQQAIDAVADELFRRACADREACPDLEIPSRATLRALALVELCRRGLGIDLDTTAAPRTEVTLVAPASDPTTAATPDGVTLPDGTTRTLLCDPVLLPIVVDNLGVPLAMGRRTRYATPAQRRATALRDGGCVFPGCSTPVSWCDNHHVEHHHHDGLTDTDNLANLCRHHHNVTHRPGWTMQATPDGWFWWTTPTGHTFWSQRHRRRRAGPTPDAVPDRQQPAA